MEGARLAESADVAIMVLIADAHRQAVRSERGGELFLRREDFSPARFETMLHEDLDRDDAI